MNDATAESRPRIFARARPPRLGAACIGRDNNVQLVRLLAAAAVVWFHCYALTDHWTDEPLWRLAPELNLGALGVKVFFVLSGFLVTQSWLSRRRLGAFVAARALRIYPALVAATLFTVLLAGLSSPLPWPAFLGDAQTLDYLWRTASGIDVRDRLPGAFATNPFPHAVNGSLWTLPVELRLYVAVAALGVAGLIARRSAWLAFVALVGALAALRPDLVATALPGAPTARVAADLALLFALGSLAYVVRDAVPLSLAAAAVAIALVAWNPLGLARGALFEPLLAYALLVAAYHPSLRWRAYNRLGDYSYGLYVYAFPVQQTLAERLPGIGPWAMLAIALPATLVLAAASWHALERNALSLKSREAA